MAMSDYEDEQDEPLFGEPLDDDYEQWLWEREQERVREQEDLDPAGLEDDW